MIERSSFDIPWESSPSSDDIEVFYRNIVDKSYATLHRIAFWMLGDHHASEDVVQESLFALLETLIADRFEGNVLPWLIVTIRHHALKYQEYAKYRVHESLDTHLDSLSCDEGCEHLEAAEDAALLTLSMDDLPPPQPRILWLRYVEDRGYAEIAALLGCTERSARHQCDLGRERLRACLEAHDHVMGGLRRNGRVMSVVPQP